MRDNIFFLIIVGFSILAIFLGHYVGTNLADKKIEVTKNESQLYPAPILDDETVKKNNTCHFT